MPVSAGFDAHRDDPLAEMRLTEDGFRELARAAGPRPALGAVLEGGYNVATLPGSSRRRWRASTPERLRGYGTAGPARIARGG